jgi:hypothetical protein
VIGEIVELARGTQELVNADLNAMLEVLEFFILGSPELCATKTQHTIVRSYGLGQEQTGSPVPSGSPDLEPDAELGLHDPRAAAAAISARNR